jgi:VIT1/CCC1 family predicted Fe2+/Mn2+ transporter
MDPQKGAGSWGSPRRQMLLTLIVLGCSALLVVLAVIGYSHDRAHSIKLFWMVGIGLVILAGIWIWAKMRR